MTIYSMVTMYTAMSGGGDVDETKLRPGITHGLNWMMLGVATALVLLLLLALFRLLRPRRRIE